MSTNIINKALVLFSIFLFVSTSLASAILPPRHAINVRSTGQPGGVYACSASEWTNPSCLWYGGPVVSCFNLYNYMSPAMVSFKRVGPDEGGVCELYRSTKCEPGSWFALATWPGTAAEYTGVWSIKCYVPKEWKNGRDSKSVLSVQPQPPDNINTGPDAVAVANTTTSLQAAANSASGVEICWPVPGKDAPACSVIEKMDQCNVRSAADGKLYLVVPNSNSQVQLLEIKYIYPRNGVACQVFSGASCQPLTWIASFTLPGTKAIWSGVHSFRCFVPDSWKAKGSEHGPSPDYLGEGEEGEVFVVKGEVDEDADVDPNVDVASPDS